MSNNYKGSPLFNDVKDVRLQTWNRCAIVFNLTADRGVEAAKAYDLKAKELHKDFARLNFPEETKNEI